MDPVVDCVGRGLALGWLRGGRVAEVARRAAGAERLPRARRPAGGPSFALLSPWKELCDDVRAVSGAVDGRARSFVSITLGHPLVDDYLEFVGARGAMNTWLAAAYDLKVFFEVVAKEPAEVTAADVFAFLAAQRAPRRGERVVRIEDGEQGLAARTIARRLSSVAGLFEYLLARGDAGVTGNPVPRGLAGRRAGRRGRGGVRLVRTPRTLPRVLSPLGGRPAAGRVANAARSGDGAGDAAGRVASLRGARLAAF